MAQQPNISNRLLQLNREDYDNQDKVEMPLESEEKMPRPFGSKFIRHQTTAVSATPYVALDYEGLLKGSLDTSFQQDMHSQNVEQLKQASIKYLAQCVVGGVSGEEGFQDNNLYLQVPLLVGDGNCQQLVGQNQLFSPFQRSSFECWLRQQHTLVDFIQLLPDSFGLFVSKELVYAIHLILNAKIHLYNQWKEQQQSFLPKLNCLQFLDKQELTDPVQADRQDLVDFSSSCPIKNDFVDCGLGCPVYEDPNLEELTLFAQNDLEPVIKTLYFSQTVRHINLKSFRMPLKSQTRTHLAEFVKALSKAVFFTLAGVSDPQPILGGLDFSREVSFAELSEGLLSRSLSRPFVPCQEQNYDFLTKKQKFM